MHGWSRSVWCFGLELYTIPDENQPSFLHIHISPFLYNIPPSHARNCCELTYKIERMGRFKHQVQHPGALPQTPPCGAAAKKKTQKQPHGMAVIRPFVARQLHCARKAHPYPALPFWRNRTFLYCFNNWNLMKCTSMLHTTVSG